MEALKALVSKGPRRKKILVAVLLLSCPVVVPPGTHILVRILSGCSCFVLFVFRKPRVVEAMVVLE